ncbi:unnamed protein product [Merluccius merluccius]
MTSLSQYLHEAAVKPRVTGKERKQGRTVHGSVHSVLACLSTVSSRLQHREMAPSPPACLCVLCGLPAAGKSSLARTVAVMAATRGWRVAVIHYDDLVPESAFRMKALEDESQAQTEWQLSRRSLLRAVERLLRDPDAASDPPDGQRIDGAAWRRCVRVLLEQRGGGGGSTEAAAAAEPVVLLLDDNFYYPSMRYEVYRLARKCSVGFCQVFVDCCVEACTSRNQRRPDPLPTGLIVEMAKRLEAPNPQKNAWEKNSITLNNSGCLSETDLQRWMELMTHAVHNPLVQVQEDDTEQKEADRLRCAISVVHQADQACRRLVSAVMKSASEGRKILAGHRLTNL